MKNKFVLGLLSFLLFSFASCNLGVGLGGAVDALPPTMEIQNPALDSIIRGEFLIGGTWSDDGEVKSVSVVLERTDGLGTPFTFDGEITKDEETKTGTWSVVINPEEKNIIDGSYQATITAVDGGKHTTSITRQFKIDNTAPLIVLQRPSAKISDTAADSYGQSFTLVGQAADDNNISLINVEIYSDAECTNLVHTVPLQNVPNTINLDVAKFVENEENTYSAIYGSSKKEGTKPFYCKIIAYDDAQRYPIEGNQSAEDTYGNSTSTYFLYEEIATSVLSKFKLPEVYKIYSGEYFLTEENRAIEGVNDVETILDSKKIGSGYFSLNPANNPNFTVSGRENLNLDGTDFTNSTNNLSSGGSLVIEVATGLDSIPVVGDSLKVYVQNCDSNGKVKGNKIYIENVQKSKSGTSYKLIATIVKSSDLIIGNDYIIGVEGKDESNNAIVTTGNGYGFHFAPSGVAPKFSDIATFINGQKSVSENNLYVSASNPADKSSYTTIKLTGKVTSDDPNINLTIKLDDKVLETFKPEQIEGELYSFEKVYTTELISNPTISAQHEIEITAVNSSTTSDPISKIVMYDAINPEISIDESDTVLANKYDVDKEDGTTVEGKYLNGTISLKFIISDDSEGTGVEVSGNNKPYFEIVDKDGNLQSIQLEGENESSTKHYIDKPAGQSFKIDTTTLQEGKTYFRVHGWDKAGNSCSYNGKDYFEEEYIIDQETDRPYIATNNETEFRFKDFKTKAELEAEKDSPGTTKANLFEKGTSVSVNISDDDLVKRYVFKVGKWADGQGENNVVMYVPDGHYDNSENKEYGKTINKKSVSISQPLNATGWYKCSIVAYDVNDNASIERNFWILVTGYAPTVTVERTPERITTVTDASKLYAGAVTSFTNRIDIDSTDGPFVITRREVISLDDTKPESERFHDTVITKDGGITETTFTDTFIPFSGAIQKKVTYIVTDTYGHDGERTVSYQIDSSAPTVETISVPNITDTESKNYRFAAELSDAAASDEVSSGVSKVEYKFGSDGNVVTINSSSLNQTITFENEPYFATESNKEIWVRGIDSVGNIGEWKKEEFAYDKAAPALTFNNRPGSLPSTSYTLTGYVTEGFGMKTNGTGTNAGKSVIKFEEYIGETKKAEKEILLTKDESETSKYTFSISLPITDGLDGDITYKVSAQDNNNKDITGITEFTVNRDITAPVINVTTPSAATFGDSSISTETAVFRGDITELNPQSIFYQKKKANETAPTALTTANVLAGNIGEWTTVDISKLGVDGDGNGSWNFTTSFDSTPATRDGKWILYIQSADKGGNICNMQTIDFCVDSAAPEIIVNIKNDESETPITATLDGSATIAVLSGSKYTISGTAKDTNGLKSFTINNSSVTVNADGTWSLPEVTEEGINEYKIVAIDNSGNGLTGTSKIEGKITQVDKSVIFDLNKPNAEITTLPSDNTWITGTGNVYIRGSASDASGIKDITVTINNNVAETIAVSDPWTYTLDCSKLSENDKTESSVHTMVVTVTDNCNKPTTITRKFKLDKTTPVLSNIVAADSKTKTKYTNNITDVVIEGFAYDGAQSNRRPVDKVIISAKDKDGNVVDLHNESESVTESVTPTTDSTNFGKLPADSKISTNNLGDGTYTFTITATDYAGTEVSEDFEIVVDKTLPTIDSNILSGWSTKKGITWAEGTPHNGNRAKLTVSITDDNTDSIYYFINDGSDSSINEPSKVGTSDWAPLNKVGNNYEGYLTFNDGTGTIYIKATDKAGNINYRQDLVYDVDTTDPEVCNLTSVDGDNTVTSGTVLANGENNIVFTVQATDAGDAARVTSVDLSHLGSTKVSAKGTYDLTNKVWTIKIPIGTDSPKQTGIKDLADGVTHSVKVVVTDKAQNSKEYDLFKINMDKTAPVPSFTNIFDADKSIAGNQVNGTITLSGNVSEANTIDSVVLEYLGKDDSNADKWFEVEHTNENVGTYTWTYAGIDTTKFPDNTTVKFRISATDKAKNTGSLEQDIEISQDTDRPKISFTNVSLSGMKKENSTITYAYLNNTNTLYGIASDDDGIEKIEYSLDYATKGESTATWKNVSFTASGSFSISNIPEGANEIYFRVKDTANLPAFLTAESSGPKLYGNETDALVKTILYLRANTIGPNIATLDFQRFDATKNAYEKDKDNNEIIVNLNDLNSSYKFGGTKYTKVKVIATVTDENDVSDVTIGGIAAEQGTTDSTKNKWTAELDLSSITQNGSKYSGVKSFTVVANDNVSTPIPSNKNFDLTLDNTPPTLSVTSHNKGDKIRTSFTLKGTIDEANSSMKYLITSSESRPSASEWTSAKEYLVPQGSTINSWDITFDGDTQNPDEFHDIDQKSYFINLYGASKGIVKNAAGSIVKKCEKADCAGNDGQTGCGADVVHDKYRTNETFYFHFQLTDSFGTVGYDDNFSLLVDPQGDIPVVTLVTPRVEKYYWTKSSGETTEIKTEDNSDTTPEGFTYKGTYATASGRISMSGSAEDDKSIEGIYIQIDPEYSGKDFNWDSSNAKLSAYTSQIKEIYKDASNNSVEGIYIGNGNNWTIKLNDSGEFNASDGGNSTIAVRFFAVDTDGNVLIPADTDIMIIEIDQGAPKIGHTQEFHVKQYSNNNTGTGTVIADVKFEDGMRLKGDWWLEGSVEDESGIQTVKINNIDALSYCKAMTGTINDKATTGYNIKYPIGNSTQNRYGKLTYDLYVVENTTDKKDNSYTFTINYDNKAPSLSNSSDASYKIDSNVVNTDGFYTIGSAASEQEGESGFARAVVYFKRGTTIYDAFLPKASSAITSGYTKGTDELYWKSVTVTGVSNSTTESVLTVAAGSNVHPGGIVKFGGSIYTIKELDASTVTIIGTPSESLANTNAEFALGAVIDRSGTEGTATGATKIKTETYGKGYWNNISGDYDCMVEKVNIQGTKAIWEGYINTKNIPDGPIEIHYVVFDQAGNSSHGSVTENAFVKNNAPMIASVTVATTFSGGDTSEYEETYYVSEKTRKVGGKEVKKSISVSNNVTVAGDENGTKAFMTIKDKSWVKPEIVGGNGNLSYTYKIDDGNTVSGGSLGNATIEGGEDYLNSTDENELKYVNGQILTFPITTTILNGITTNSTIDAPTTFLYTISDSTEGVAGGLTATIDLKLAVNYHDIVPPKAVILPFEWNGTGKTEYSEREDNEYKVRCYIPNNSIYESELVNGHIELNEDLDYTGTKFTAASGLMDKDPKVSGKISIRGYAYDDIRLSNLWIKMDNFTFTNGTAGSGTTAGYVKAASYTTANGWETYGNISDGWKFTVFAHDGVSAYEGLPVLTETSTDTDKANYEKIHNSNLGKYYGSYFGQNGHKVYWQLDLDTEKLSTVAAVDRKVYLMVEDERGTGTDKYSSTEKSSSRASTDGVLNTPYYQMDVVPYITKVYTMLGGMKAGNWSSYGRTAAGHYSVASDEIVDIYGFNLGKTGYEPYYGTEKLSIPVNGKISFDVSKVTTSGNIALKVNNVLTLNNDNRDFATGTSNRTLSKTSKLSDKVTYGYNLQPNSDNNNNLTDDVYFDVWDIRTAAKPTSGAVSDVVMKINPSSNRVGFAFTNGNFNFAMPNTNTSYTDWQRSYEPYSCVGLAYDTAGTSYAVAAGGDSNGHQADLYNFMSSKFGVGKNNDKTGSTGGQNSLRFESIGQVNDTVNIGTQDGPETDEFIIDKQRFRSSNIVTSRVGNNPNATNIYLAYYDNINDEIRFRAGTLNDSSTGKTNIGTISDYFKGNEFRTSSTNTKDCNYGYYEATKCQVLATSTGTGVLGQAGNYVSIGVVNNTSTSGKDVLVMVWYDQHNKKLCYAYNTTPTTSRTGVNSTGWTKGPDILSEGGEYCQLAVDAGGGIHIAAYTGLNNGSDLKYVYLSSYDDNEPDVCTVDSNGVVGDNITIDVAKVGNSYVPYIGYYALSQAMPKYAYPLANSVKDGVDDAEIFTGDWEVSFIPTSSTVPQSRINVGVFKNANGERVYSTTNKAQDGTKGTNNVGAGSGNCWGNGSNYPILGYETYINSKESWVETAQMK